MPQTATEAVIDYCLTTRQTELDEELRDQLKMHLLDHVGLVIGGHAQAASTTAITRGITAISGQRDDATVLATGERLPAGAAALLNGALAHSLDFDDTHRASSLHPGAPVIPAALATAEREDATTETLLHAINAGYNVACRIGEAVNPDEHYAQGFHITATCGTFGATAAAGIIAELDESQLASAFGINGSQAAGSLQFLANGAWNKRLHPGLAARRAITAVSFAQSGFRGSADPIEGDYGFFHAYTTDPLPSRLQDLDAAPAVQETAIKPYPCCRYMHPALDALTDIAPTVNPANIEAIRVELPRPGVRLTGTGPSKNRPENFVDCQFSMPFAAALALTTGEAGLTAFLDAQSRLDDHQLHRLMDATTVTTTDRVQSLFPEQWAARVVVDTGTERHERVVEQARGEPENPLSWPEVEEKLRSLTAAADWQADLTTDLISSLKAIDDRSLPDLMEIITQAPRSVTAD